MQLVRPLLGWARRETTHEYVRARKMEVRADALNEDERFSRVRVRRQLLPLLETFNPRVVEALARAAELLRADADALAAQAEQLLLAATATTEATTTETMTEVNTAARPLRVDVLRASDAALRRRALRLWLKMGRGSVRRLTLTHIRGVERLLAGERGRRVAELPGGASVERRRGLLVFQPPRENG